MSAASFWLAVHLCCLFLGRALRHCHMHHTVEKKSLFYDHPAAKSQHRPRGGAGTFVRSMDIASPRNNLPSLLQHQKAILPLQVAHLVFQRNQKSSAMTDLV